MEDERDLWYVAVVPKPQWYRDRLEVLWEAPRDIAEAICADERSYGLHYQLRPIIKAVKHDPVIWLRDYGQFDEILEGLHIVKYGRRLDWECCVPQPDSKNPMVYVARIRRHGFANRLDVLWETREDIARAICSDERTSGQEYFLAWTEKRGQAVTWWWDDGLYSQVLADLGIAQLGHYLTWESKGKALRSQGVIETKGDVVR